MMTGRQERHSAFAGQMTAVLRRLAGNEGIDAQIDCIGKHALPAPGTPGNAPDRPLQRADHQWQALQGPGSAQRQLLLHEFSGTPQASNPCSPAVPCICNPSA